MVNRPIFDTNVVIEYRKSMENIIQSSFFTSIVFFELLATSIDQAELQTYTRWRELLKKQNRILSPTESDFWETGKSINRLYKTKAAQESKLKKLRLDALIARLAVKSRNFVVTVDTDDFALIKKDMKQLVVVPASDFFS